MRSIEIQLQDAEEALERQREENVRLIMSRKCVGRITVCDSGVTLFARNGYKLKTGEYLAFIECSEFDEAGILKRPTIKLEDN